MCVNLPEVYLRLREKNTSTKTFKQKKIHKRKDTACAHTYIQATHTNTPKQSPPTHTNNVMLVPKSANTQRPHDPHQ